MSDDVNNHARHKRFEALLRQKLPAHVEVYVSEWAGCDENWDDPVYVNVDDPDEEREYYDAICDLTSAPIEEQVEFVIEQLIRG